MPIKIITVKGTNPGTVGIWEVNPAHPTGEAFVADKPVKVAETNIVNAAIKAGRIEVVKPKRRTSKPKADK